MSQQALHALVTLFVALGPATQSSQPRDAVRTVDPRIRALISSGRARSAHFRALLETIDETDVLAYIVRGTCGSTFAACTKFAGSSNGQRVLQIVLARPAAGDGAIVLIGHELEHVLEIGRAKSVVDSATLGTLYGALDGRQLAFQHSFETTVASEVQSAIARELSAAWRTPSATLAGSARQPSTDHAGASPPDGARAPETTGDGRPKPGPK